MAFSLLSSAVSYVLQFSNLAQKWYMFSLGKIFSNIIILCLQGLAFLVYPLLGHLTDVYVTRYRTLKCGAGILVAGEMTFFLLVLVTV